MKKFFSKFHYEKRFNPLYFMIIVIFSPILFGYFLVISSINLFYNIFQGKKLEKPVISVGNITTGGVGKTPITAEIANYLSKNNKKVAILSRGYGGKLSGKVTNVISDGENIFCNAKMCGDEVIWLAKNCKNSIVLTSHNRYLAGKKAIDMGAEILILDDGFQHRKLHRNFELAVIDFQKQFGNNLLLPFGPLREPISSLKRADKIILVNKSKDNPDEFMRKLKKRFKKPVAICQMTISDIYNIKNNEEKLNETKVLAFCSIAQPSQFYAFLNDLEIKTLDFNDHHDYNKNDLEKIYNFARKNGIKTLVTTEKDAVKLESLNLSSEFDIFIAKMSPVLDLEELLKEFL